MYNRLKALQRSVALTLVVIASTVDVDTVRAQVVQRVVVPSCGNCSIQSERVATLSQSKPGTELPEIGRIVSTSQGTLIFTSASLPGDIRVYGATGDFLTSIGRQGGGPGEYQMPVVTVGPSDTLHVLDVVNARYSIVSPDLKFIRSSQLASPIAPRSVVALGSGGLLISANVLTGGGIGHPYHVIDSSGELKRSFGASGNAFHAGPDSRNLPRVALARTEKDAFWSIAPNRYELELWGLDGKLRKKLVRSAEWFPGTKPATEPPHIEKPSPSIEGLTSDDEGLLWIIISVPDRSWRKRSVRTTIDGWSWYTPSDRDTFYDTIVEVIDPQSGRLVSSRRFPEWFVNFVKPGTVVRVREHGTGGLDFDIWKLNPRSAP